jgi:hypothetical protein
MKQKKEIALKGGQSNLGVVRIGDTVRRPPKRDGFTHLLLKYLEENDFPYASRFLGYDDEGREMYSYIQGEVPHGQFVLHEENILECAQILRQFHDVSSKSSLRGDQETVCHNDFAPWNIVVRDGQVAGIIDFDEAAPGVRIEDLGYFIWTVLNLGDDIPVEEQARKMKLICDMYGLKDRSEVVDAILRQQERILEKRKILAESDITPEKRDYSAGKVIQIQKEIEWVLENKQNILDQI